MGAANDGGWRPGESETAWLVKVASASNLVPMPLAAMIAWTRGIGKARFICTFRKKGLCRWRQSGRHSLIACFHASMVRKINQSAVTWPAFAWPRRGTWWAALAWSLEGQLKRQSRVPVLSRHAQQPNRIGLDSSQPGPVFFWLVRHFFYDKRGAPQKPEATG